MTKRWKKQPVQVTVLPPVYRQHNVEAGPERLKVQQRVDQLVGILVEAALVCFKELSGDEG